jgi:hypothetical protein
MAGRQTGVATRGLRRSFHRGSPFVAFTPFLLLPLLFLLSSPLSAIAQENVTGIDVIAGGGPGIQCAAGFAKVDVDLNQGAGGDFIYLCYAKGVGAPITGLIVTVGKDSVPGEEGYTKIDVDLNRGAGGNFIWLWYTKDPACATIRDVHVQADQGPPPAGYTKIDVDLNRDAGGAFIYASYLKF